MSKFDDTEWMQRGTCRGGAGDYDALDMHPHPADTSHIEAVKGLCYGCPVRGECLAYALDNGENHGVWGGLMPDERVKARRRMNRAA